MDKESEIIDILRKTLGEQRALLTAAAAILLRKPKEERDSHEQAWLEAAEKYGVIREKTSES